MIDTIKVRCLIDKDKGKELQSFLKVYTIEKFDAVLRRFTVDTLKGSFDNRISIRLTEGENIKTNGIPKVYDFGKWTVEIEFSLHKFLEGHNCYDAPEDLTQILVTLRDIELMIGFDFLDYQNIELRRIDIGFVYDMEDMHQYEMFKLLQRKKYKKKEPRYYGSAVGWYGATKKIKFYNKHAEFLKNGYKTLKKAKPELAEYVKEHSQNILRVEVELWNREITELFGGQNLMSILEKEDNVIILRKKFDDTIKEIWNENDEVVFRENEVINLLVSDTGRFLSGAFGTWKMLLEHGELELEKMIAMNKIPLKRSTYYRHKKILKEKKIVWNVSTIPEMYI